MCQYRLSSPPAAENSTSTVPARNARSCSSVVSFASFMSITMPYMIDPFIRVQTHSFMEIRNHFQTHTILDKTAT